MHCYQYLKLPEYSAYGKLLVAAYVLAFLASPLEVIQVLFEERAFGEEILEELELILEYFGDDGEVNGQMTLLRRNDELENLRVALDVDVLQLLSAVLGPVVLQEQYCTQLGFSQQDIPLELLYFPLDEANQLVLFLSAQFVYYQYLLGLRLVPQRVF